MNIEKAKTLMCPFTFNQDQKNANYKCSTVSCMAWEDDGFVSNPKEALKIILGHCKLIDGGSHVELA